MPGPQTLEPSAKLQAAYLGFLAEQPQLSGDTGASYILLLPTILRNIRGAWATRLTLHPNIKAGAANLKIRKPSANPLRRSPLPLRVLVDIWHDPSILLDVRAALVVQYHLALRGGNVYFTSWSKRHPDIILRWTDLQLVVGRKGETNVVVRIRAEKNATTAVGSFQPELLIPSEFPAELPCPIAALRAVGLGRNHDGLIFPKVTATRVQRALDKHQIDGKRFTPHSLRGGAVSDFVGAGGGDLGARQKGRWKTRAALDRYAQQTDTRKRLELRRLVMAEREACAPGARPEPSVAPDAGEPDRPRRTQLHPMHLQVLAWPCRPAESPRLVIICQPRANSVWAYAYDASGSRSSLTHNGRHAHYVTLSFAEMEKVTMVNQPMLDSTDPYLHGLAQGTALLRDLQFVRQQSAVAQEKGYIGYTRLDSDRVPDGKRGRWW